VRAVLKGFFRYEEAIFRPSSARGSYRWADEFVDAEGDGSEGERLMYDLAALGIAAACFAFAYLILWLLDRV